MKNLENQLLDPVKIITDEDGGIIEIPIDDPGDPWAEPPYVFIGEKVLVLRQLLY